MKAYRKKAQGARQAYQKRIEAGGVFLNTMETALPQTAVARAVRRHMESGGTKRKKVMIIGFDGARADCCCALCDTGSAHFAPMYSGVQCVKNAGGMLLSYAGGELESPQKTLTQQGWAAILTGCWSQVNGVVEFDVLTGAETVLMEYARKGKKTAFYGIWPHHFEVTYSAEMERAKRENRPCRYVQCADDEELKSRMIEAAGSDLDVTIGILEAPDNAGHGTPLGFWGQNPEYMRALFYCDHCAYAILKAIEARPTYKEEDWLVVITSDHGGHLRDHGSQDVRDRTTFVVSNRMDVFEDSLSPIPQM